MSVMLNNLTTGATYNVRVVAYTRVGAGPYSQPVSGNFLVIYSIIYVHTHTYMHYALEV